MLRVSRGLRCKRGRAAGVWRASSCKGPRDAHAHTPARTTGPARPTRKKKLHPTPRPRARLCQEVEGLGVALEVGQLKHRLRRGQVEAGQLGVQSGAGGPKVRDAGGHAHAGAALRGGCAWVAGRAAWGVALGAGSGAGILVWWSKELGVRPMSIWFDMRLLVQALPPPGAPPRRRYRDRSRNPRGRARRARARGDQPADRALRGAAPRAARARRR